MSSQRPDRLVMPVLNLKGGTSKTTSAVFLAHVLHESGYTVALVDADPQASSVDWSRSAPEPFPFLVLPMATPRLHEQLHDHLPPEVDAVVIDTPPLADRAHVVVSALRVATLAVVPTAPTPLEVGRLAAVRETLEQAGGMRYATQRTYAPVPAAVLLTRTVANAGSTAAWRQQIRQDEWWCLRAQVGRLELFAQAAGDNVVRAMDTAYGDAMIELLEGQG